MIATGFLRLGPSGAVAANAAAGRARRYRHHDVADVHGLTVGCARCHDHKFDPIPQKDYYRIQSVFFSTAAVSIRWCRAEVEAANRAETQRIDGSAAPAAQDEDADLEAPYQQDV